jgi:anti-sigma factor RsiW
MSDYLDGDLVPAERERVERHVAFCPRCWRVLSNLRRTVTALRSLGAAHATEADAATEQAKRAWRERSG